MYTWMLFTNMFLGWGASDNAIFIRDANRNPIWRDIVRELARYHRLWLLLGLAFWVTGIVFVHSLLFFFVPPLVIFILALALTLGPVIVEERSKSSWEPLLAAPYDMRAILLGKASGALWHIRSLTYAIGILLMCVSAGAGTLGLKLIPSSMARTHGWYSAVLCGLMFLMPVLCSLIFIFDRMQHYALIAVAALASGTAATSIRVALSNAITVVLLIWLIETAATVAFLTLEQGGAWHPHFTSILSAAALGPTISYGSQMSIGHAALFIGGTLLLREVLIRSLWRWTLESARRVPAAGPTEG